MTVVVNGVPRTVPRDVSLAALVGEVSADATGVAAAVNDAVVPRSEWGSRTLRDDDRVEVLTAVQGG